MAVECDFVLLFAGDAPLFNSDLSVITHRQASTWLAVTRNQRCQVLRTNLSQLLQFVLSCLLAVRFQQDLTQAFAYADRCIRSGVRTTSDC